MVRSTNSSSRRDDKSRDQVFGTIGFLSWETRIYPSRGWFLDTVAENHVTHSRSDFVEYQSIEGNVTLINRRRLKVTSMGTVILRCSTGKTLTMEKVLRVPKNPRK